MGLHALITVQVVLCVGLLGLKVCLLLLGLHARLGEIVLSVGLCEAPIFEIDNVCLLKASLGCYCRLSLNNTCQCYILVAAHSRVSLRGIHGVSRLPSSLPELNGVDIVAGRRRVSIAGSRIKVPRDR